MTLPLLVFSDLDGTLLDHDTYSWDAAQPALDKLKNIGAGVVLASSKTAPEITQLRAQMGLSDWPAIVENGAGLLAAHAQHSESDAVYPRLRDALNQMPVALRQHYRGFGDMRVEEIAQITGLSTDDATRAAQRAFSEPGLWSGSNADQKQFLSHLSDQGISAREGGRFLTLSYGQTKADQMAALIAQLQPRHTLALGDAPNDVEMLETAQIGIVIANPHRQPLPTLVKEATGTIIRTKAPGPTGWNQAVLEILQQLKLV